MKNRAAGLLLAGLVAFLTAAVTFVFLDRRASPEIVIQAEALPTIVIDVSGGVATPGVYKLPGASRLRQAIDRAGGLTANADVTSLNLAERLVDGDDVVIPVIDSGRPAEAVDESSPDPPNDDFAASGQARDRAAPIDLNTASAVELDILPGVGPVIAGRIIEYRESNGPFATIDELAEIEGISPAMVDELRPMVTLGD